MHTLFPHPCQAPVIDGLSLKRNALQQLIHGEVVRSIRELQRFCEVVDLSDGEADELFQLAERAVRGPRPDTGAPSTQERTHLTQENLERRREVSRVLEIPFNGLTAAVDQAHREWDATAQEGDTAQIIRQNLVAQALARYYTPEKLARAQLTRYRGMIDGVSIDTSIVSRPAWVSTPILIRDHDEQCRYLSGEPPSHQVPLSPVARRLAGIEREGRRVWNDPVYRLMNLTMAPPIFAAEFTVDEYFRYAFVPGLLHEELAQAIRAAQFNLDAVVSRAADLLPLRNQLLPDGAAVVDFPHRVCIGGIMAILAIARSHPEHHYPDFAIAIERRSSLVADNQNRLCLIPAGFHQHKVDPRLEVNLSFTVYREIFEELFKGEEVEREVRRLSHDWFLYECEPLRWLIEHPEASAFELTGFGIALASGTYEIAFLLSVRDEKFWDLYHSFMEINWEFKKSPKAGILRSSRDRQALTQLLREPGWDEASLFSLMQGLNRLKALEPERVRLPEIQRLAP